MRMSCGTTRLTTSIGIAKPMPAFEPDGEIIALLTPITRPLESSKGPPEFPGFSEASVWMISSISRPLLALSVRPRALTTPAVTVCCNPSGLPMAIAICPG